MLILLLYTGACRCKNFVGSRGCCCCPALFSGLGLCCWGVLAMGRAESEFDLSAVSNVPETAMFLLPQVAVMDVARIA